MSTEMEVKDLLETCSVKLLAAWNTKREYTKHGQRIAVWSIELADGRKCLLMCDYDRNIDYCLNYEEFDTLYEMREYVMWAYDSNKARCRLFIFGQYACRVIEGNPVESLTFN